MQSLPALPPLLAGAFAMLAPWYQRHGHRLPTMVGIVLLSLVMWLAAALVWSLVPTPQSTRWQALPVRASAPVSVQRNPSETIANAHLFGVYQAPALASVNLEAAPDTNLNFTLLGIFAGTSESDSRALISTASGDEKPYKIGDDLASGVSLHAIFPDRVILARSGSFETLRLDKNAPSTATYAPVAEAAPAMSEMGQKLAEIREQLLLDPSKAGDYIRVQPFNTNGVLGGYRLYPGRNREMFNGIGLRPGDLVTAVNGIQLDDGQKALQTLNELKQASTVTLSIERGGQVQTVNVSLN